MRTNQPQKRKNSKTTTQEPTWLKEYVQKFEEGVEDL